MCCLRQTLCVAFNKHSVLQRRIYHRLRGDKKVSVHVILLRFIAASGDKIEFWITRFITTTGASKLDKEKNLYIKGTGASDYHYPAGMELYSPNHIPV